MREACLSLGLDNLAEICVYFPNALCSWKPIGLPFVAPIHFVFIVIGREGGQQIVTLGARAERIRNNIHSFVRRASIKASAPAGDLSWTWAFYPHPPTPPGFRRCRTVSERSDLIIRCRSNGAKQRFRPGVSLSETLNNVSGSDRKLRSNWSKPENHTFGTSTQLTASKQKKLPVMNGEPL